MRTRLCELFGIDVPVFAFSYRREVVAAVSRAGGMGVLGALQFSPEQLEEELCWLDAHVEGRPYGVDVVMPTRYEGAERGGLSKDALELLIPEGHRRYVEEVLARYEVPGLPPEVLSHESLLGWSEAAGRSQVAVALQHPIRLIANALGTPPRDVVDEAHRRGVQVVALVGTAAHARKQAEAGVDVVVAVGTEAGGHTGEIGTMVLVPEVVDAVHPIPVLAAGGIGRGRQIAAALALGAEGVWTGSLWLGVEEAHLNPVLRDKLLAATSSDTVRSRSMSGKPARQLKTAWTEAWDGAESPGPLPMPLQFMLTADAVTRMHHHAGTAGSRAHELLGSPVGQIVGSLREVRPVRAVLESLEAEFRESVLRVLETGGTGEHHPDSARRAATGTRRGSE
ncbi:2-nitropropane dioxygenase [Myxococcus stipitatus DSM 14675]|uniref:2-nitropropane dioxygenase n=1 Tax=Myxococcus stipitatus (strain DSM 14675 / JCM 12634 / Mx s8) TaxID=1278073 RepID=L7UDH7_MYXSD|nr:nitronate monooxygenase family protein [Myxococcus stipitatus]AGC46113.1 2-nitropropane dioxygenase [Myxococcus stipitatus DSM 14675]